MEIASISGDTVLLLYHPAQTAADVGQQFTLMEVPERTEGLVVQVISNDSLEYVGLQQEMIQHILERRISRQTQAPVDRERGMGEIKSLKVATAKIRKRIQNNAWHAWDGWIPTRNVEISQIGAGTLLENIMPSAHLPIRSFVRLNESTPMQFDGPRLRTVNVITGVKGSGKSHLAKHLVLALSERRIPVIVFDLNGEYLGLPNCQELCWAQNLVLNLGEVGYRVLEKLVRTLYPLPSGQPSEAVFEHQLPIFFREREDYCRRQGTPLRIDIPYLINQNWEGGDYVVRAIRTRLGVIDERNLFWREHPRTVDQNITPFYATPTPPSFQIIYDSACEGRPVIFDMRDIPNSLQKALASSMVNFLQDICEREADGQGRYPFVFFEEAHFYVEDILNLITRGRHIGIASVFVTNTPQELPEAVFRQLDNLFLLALAHKDDIRNVSRNSFTDQDTIESFATRMPERHALIIGDVTDRYPLVVAVDPLPADVPPSGRTRSTWDRFTT